MLRTERTKQVKKELISYIVLIQLNLIVYLKLHALQNLNFENILTHSTLISIHLYVLSNSKEVKAHQQFSNSKIFKAFSNLLKFQIRYVGHTI